MLIAALKLVITAALLPFASDTPPARRLPPPPPRELRAVDDVILTARLANGDRAPSTIVLPQLSNRAQVIDFIRRNHPDSATVQPSVIPVAWVYIDEGGRVHLPELIVSSGSARLDALAIAAVKRATFQPALIDKVAVPVWVMLPVQVGALATRSDIKPRSGPDVGPVFTPYTTKPTLRNREEVGRALVRFYPRELRDRGVSGTAVLWILIDESGHVARTQVKESSGYPELDAAAVRVANTMLFTQARNGDQIVAVWINLPIVFKTK